MQFAAWCNRHPGFLNKQLPRERCWLLRKPSRGVNAWRLAQTAKPRYGACGRALSAVCPYICPAANYPHIYTWATCMHTHILGVEQDNVLVLQLQYINAFTCSHMHKEFTHTHISVPCASALALPLDRYHHSNARCLVLYMIKTNHHSNFVKKYVYILCDTEHGPTEPCFHPCYWIADCCCVIAVFTVIHSHSAVKMNLLVCCTEKQQITESSSSSIFSSPSTISTTIRELKKTQAANHGSYGPHVGTFSSCCNPEGLKSFSLCQATFQYIQNKKSDPFTLF